MLDISEFLTCLTTVFEVFYLNKREKAGIAEIERDSD